MKFLDDNNLARINSFLDNVDTGDFVVYGDLEAYSCKLAGLDKKLSKSLDTEVQVGSSPQELSMSPVGPLSDSASRKTLIYLILTLNHIYPDYDFSLLRAHHFKKESGLAKAEEVIDTHLLEVSKRGVAGSCGRQRGAGGDSRRSGCERLRGRASMGPMQRSVWEATPGFGDAPFLDTLWSAVDEGRGGVREPRRVARRAGGGCCGRGRGRAIDLKSCDVYSYKSDNETDPFAGGRPGRRARRRRCTDAFRDPATNAPDRSAAVLLTPPAPVGPGEPRRAPGLAPAAPAALVAGASPWAQRADSDPTAAVAIGRPRPRCPPAGEKAAVWSFNYFFYNKKLKRILYLSCRAVTKAAAEEGADEEDSKYLYNSDDEGDEGEANVDYGMANEMDI
ncbi:hypothetical protein MNEG_11685 [Monoraphidium neglectum]|uniref:Repressor of RNA polymerase III transcription n=1 Tax=Monoraphidium neglectum TaxID=145388 RepID=A0A0D2KKE3_9CHLO|nr:hypothetical protein MNEG_11685 [Monoraphidium neglectum]KIY96278.1 hypothetical protein MNEG_11685 [Monoraphidium neglectum]|eukprot:XP_013895298.1 hypothetical protein MNEG_11685 [Monoraphidium neglectum]